MNSQSVTEDNVVIKPQEKRCLKITKIIIIGIISLLILGFLFSFIFFHSQVIAYLDSLFEWIKNNPAFGCFVFYILFTFWIICGLPGLILTLIGGALFTKIFGGILGLFISMLLGTAGHLSGGCGCFFISRFVLYNCLRKYFNNISVLNAFEDAITRSGLKISFLFRLAGFLPQTILNYGLPLTQIKFYEFSLSILGLAPWELFKSYFGFCIGNIASILSGNYQASTLETISMIFGILLSIIIIFYIIILTRRELNSLNKTSKPIKELSPIVKIGINLI